MNNHSNHLSQVVPQPQQVQQPRIMERQYQEEDDIPKRIFEVYGPNYDPFKKETSSYARILRMMGSICAPCYTCQVMVGSGPQVDIKQGQIGYKLEFGRLVGILKPGIHQYDPYTQKIKVEDMRRSTLDLPVQKVLTRELLEITILGKVTYGFFSRQKASFLISNHIKYMINTCMGIMKSLVSERSLQELQSDITEYNAACQVEVSKVMAQYGIEVLSIDIASLRLPDVLIKALAIESETRKENQAKIRRAQGYLDAAPSYAQAGKELTGNPIAVEISYHELLRNIAFGKRSTTVLTDTVTEF